MVVETYTHGPVYPRASERGRPLPAGRRDLMEFEIVSVVTSRQAAERLR